MYILLDHYIGKSDRLLDDARDLREEAARHRAAGNYEESDRLLEKHGKLVDKSLRLSAKAARRIDKIEARR